MIAVVLALAPIFLLILLGHILKRQRFVDDSFWPATEKITYYITFPALLAGSLARASLGSLPWGEIVLCVSGATVLSGVLVLIAGPLIRPSRDRAGNATLSSVFQGAIRPNTYVGLAGATALYGQQGMTVTALCIAATVPLVNVMAVSALISLAPPEGSPQSPLRRLGNIALGIAKNPLIIACAIGIVVNVLGWGVPPVIGPLLDILAKASLPMGLLAVGAGLQLASPTPQPEKLSAGLWRRFWQPFLAASVLKLLALPLLVGGAASAFALAGWPLSSPVIGTMVLWAGLPCSASAYVLARQMGGDAPMMAAVITWQTVLAMLSLPLLISALGAILPP